MLLVLTLICLSGYMYAANRWLKIDLAHTPLFCLSLIGLLLYFNALAGSLQKGTAILIFTGMVLSLFWIPVAIRRWRDKGRRFLSGMFILFSVLVGLAFILTWQMKFTVIDDYVYWGIIGKYLYLNNHLPDVGNPLDVRILAYTPGTGLLHYFFYLLVGKYSEHISYFAQSVFLISCLFVVVEKARLRRSIVYLGGLSLFLILFYGSVFTKLQVDYLLAILVFSIFWIYRSPSDYYIRILTVSAPVCFLFLIKQIGFFLGIFVLVTMAADLWFGQQAGKREKIRSSLALACVAAVLLLVRFLWNSHITAMGFVEFHNAVNADSIKRALSIFTDPTVQRGFLLYIKGIFIGPADRLNLPYLFWYGLVVFLWYNINKTLSRPEQRRLKVFTGLMAMVFCVYLILLYFMQIILFNIGSAGHTVGLTRYLNIVFSEFVLIGLGVYFYKIVCRRYEIKTKAAVATACVLIVVLGLSRFGVHNKRHPEDDRIQSLSQKIQATLPASAQSVGILSRRHDNLPHLQFLYHLLPHRVDYNVRYIKTKEQMLGYIPQYDYLILYEPESFLIDWVNPYMIDGDGAETIGLLKVNTGTSTGAETLVLDKISLL